MLFVHLCKNWRTQRHFVVANAEVSTIGCCLLLVGVLNLAGCGNSDNITNSIEDIRVMATEKRTHISPVLKETLNKPLVINLTDLKDPFQLRAIKDGIKDEGTTEDKIANRLVTNRKKPRESLENYQLSQLSMVGTLRMNNTQWAFIKIDSEAIKGKKGYINLIQKVKKDDYMGQNQGKITDISNDTLTLIDANNEYTIIKLSVP